MIRHTFFLLGVVLSCAATLFSQSPAPLVGGTVFELIASGDELVSKEFSNQKALQKYLEALALEPNNAEVLWRISRAYVDIGEHLPTTSDAEKQLQLQTYERSAEYAEKAVRANAQSSMAYTRRAIANGRVALFRGVWESLDLVKKVKVDLEKALELSPANDVAHYVLGRTHAKVSERPRVFRWPLGLSWANLDDAVRHYEMAIKIKPGFIMYHLDCARAYVETDEIEKARTYLSMITSLPTQDEDDEQYRKEAKELMEKIREK